MEIFCEGCGSKYDIPEWLYKIAVGANARLMRCDRCDEVDEWVQAHRVKAKNPLYIVEEKVNG